QGIYRCARYLVWALALDGATDRDADRRDSGHHYRAADPAALPSSPIPFAPRDHRIVGGFPLDRLRLPLSRLSPVVGDHAVGGGAVSLFPSSIFLFCSVIFACFHCCAGRLFILSSIFFP